MNSAARRVPARFLADRRFRIVVTSVDEGRRGDLVIVGPPPHDLGRDRTDMPRRVVVQQPDRSVQHILLGGPTAVVLAPIARQGMQGVPPHARVRVVEHRHQVGKRLCVDEMVERPWRSTSSRPRWHAEARSGSLATRPRRSRRDASRRAERAQDRRATQPTQGSRRSPRARPQTHDPYGGGVLATPLTIYHRVIAGGCRRPKFSRQ